MSEGRSPLAVWTTETPQNYGAIENKAAARAVRRREEAHGGRRGRVPNFEKVKLADKAEFWI